jgi:hypothetical protein
MARGPSGSGAAGRAAQVGESNACARSLGPVYELRCHNPPPPARTPQPPPPHAPCFARRPVPACCCWGRVAAAALCVQSPTDVLRTAAGPSGIVVTDMLKKMQLLTETKVVMIDTLHLFPETYDLMEKARDFYELHENGRIFRLIWEGCDSHPCMQPFQSAAIRVSAHSACARRECGGSRYSETRNTWSGAAQQAREQSLRSSLARVCGASRPTSSTTSPK